MSTPAAGAIPLGSRTPAPAGMSRAVERWTPWLVCVACVLAMAAKAPDFVANPQFWAEDGAIFFQQQQGFAYPRAFEPYAGYLHLWPRLVAWLATQFPLAATPAVYAGAALLANAGAVAFFVLRLRPFGWATVAFLAVFLAPTSGEIFGPLTNSQWFLQLFLLAACALPSPPAGAPRQLATVAAVTVVALTGPFAVLLAAILAAAAAFAGLPVAAARAIRPALRALVAGGGAWRLAALLVGAAVQAAFLLRHPDAAGSAHTPALLLEALGRWTQSHLFDVALLPASLFALVLMALAAGAAWRLRGQPSALVFLFALLALAAAEIALASGKADVIGAAMGFGDRYFFLGKVGFWLLAFVALGRIRGVPAGAIAIGSLVLASLLQPRWLQRSALENLHWRESVAPAVERGETVRVPINPVPWAITVEPRR